MISEISATITLTPNCSITAKVCDIMDENEPSRLEQMRKALHALIQHDSKTPQKSFPHAKTSPDSETPITEKQVGMLRKLLQVHNIPEEEFCRQNNVKTIEDMTKQAAHPAIGKLCDTQKQN